VTRAVVGTGFGDRLANRPTSPSEPQRTEDESGARNCDDARRTPNHPSPGAFRDRPIVDRARPFFERVGSTEKRVLLLESFKAAELAGWESLLRARAGPRLAPAAAGGFSAAEYVENGAREQRDRPVVPGAEPVQVRRALDEPDDEPDQTRHRLLHRSASADSAFIVDSLP
jgi:hypothetical protein